MTDECVMSAMRDSLFVGGLESWEQLGSYDGYRLGDSAHSRCLSSAVPLADQAARSPFDIPLNHIFLTLNYPMLALLSL